jgi:hypothetical protein
MVNYNIETCMKGCHTCIRPATCYALRAVIDGQNYWDGNGECDGNTTGGIAIISECYEWNKTCDCEIPNAWFGIYPKEWVQDNGEESMLW